MKTQNLALFSLVGCLLQGCIGVRYIPPASSQTAKTELIHVSRLTTRGDHLYIVKVNGTVVMKPAFGGAKRPYDFYLLPGSYSVEYEIRNYQGNLPSIDTTPIFTKSGKLIGQETTLTGGGMTSTVVKSGTTTIVLGAEQAGKKMNDSQFLFQRE